MSEMPNTVTVHALRRAVCQILGTDTVRIRRLVDGALGLWAIARQFADVDDPRSWLEEQLAAFGIRLPDRTIVFLRSPDEIDEQEERAILGPPHLTTPTWGDAIVRETESLDIGSLPPDERRFGSKVVAFWGLKGGVGRSTALAYVAAQIGRRRKVLAIDLDLDSPGLVATLAQGAPSEGTPRFDDLLRLAAQGGADDALREEIRRALRRHRDDSFRVDVLGPDGADRDFVLALLGPLSPTALYRGETSALRRFVRLAIEASGAEITLIDARSGYCDESAMTVLDLSDEVVLFVSPAPSTFVSLEPAIMALERNKRALGRPRSTYLVAGMVPAGQEARRRIMEELRAVTESARNRVIESLGISLEDLPSDVEVIPVDYAPSIVENEGQIVEVQPAAYREIAERLGPSDSPLPVRLVEAGFCEQVLREASIPAPQAEDDDDAGRNVKLFTTTRDLKDFVRHEMCLILGAKGTGKTYLHRICLNHRDLLEQRSGIRAVGGTLFVDGYSKRLVGAGSQPPIVPDLLRQLQRKSGAWSDIWSALALGRALSALASTGTEATGFIGGRRSDPLSALVAATSSRETESAVLRAIRDPLRLDETWGQIDQHCAKQGIKLTILFDDLDVALSERPSDSAKDRRARQEMIGGLLERVVMSWLPRYHLSAKVFLREDIFRQIGLEDEAKFTNRRIVLKWGVEEIWRLVVRATAIASPVFARYLQNLRIDLERLEEHADIDIDRALSALWGERMGEGESNTRTKAWVQRRLHDGAQRMFPRTALWLLKYAFEAQKKLGPGTEPPVIQPAALRSAVPSVSAERLRELRVECSPKEKRLIDSLRGFDSYQDDAVFLQALKNASSGERSARTPSESLEDLKALGVVERGNRRDGTSTVRIVDLYAYAPELKINRLGRG